MYAIYIKNTIPVQNFNSINGVEVHNFISQIIIYVHML